MSSKKKPNSGRPGGRPVTVTHEPAEPVNWPDGHVGVVLTGDEIGECVEITIHGVRHYLHASTARELSNMLLDRIDEWNPRAMAAGWPPV